jgi:acyl-CoA thioesterase YciA
VLGALRGQDRRLEHEQLAAGPDGRNSEVSLARRPRVGTLRTGLIRDFSTRNALISLRPFLFTPAAATKRLLEGLWHRPVKEDIDRALAAHLEARNSPEAAEGIAAFHEKRPQKWAPGPPPRLAWGARAGQPSAAMAAPPTKPQGEIVIRAIAMPADTNANGDIFGGWIVSQMDLGGAVLARTLAGSRVVTVAIEAMSFVAPVYVGDTVTCYARLKGIGRTSMKVLIEVWSQHYSGGPGRCVTHGVFTYVAIDGDGKPHPVKREK